MKIYDISMNIKQYMPVYKNKGEKRPQVNVHATHDANNYYESSILLDLHTGTHIDAPLHMIRGGDTIETYDLNRYICKCKVLNFEHVHDKITSMDLMDKGIEKNDFILLRTKNSYDTEYNPNFIYLDQSGAQYLAKQGINGVGIDSLGIERGQINHETHITLFKSKIMIVEGLVLKEVPEGIYTLIILPIKIDLVEAAPARAILIEDGIY